MNRSVLQNRPGWSEAISNLQTLRNKLGDAAEENARQLAALYVGKRALMVFDAVASRRRSYARRVIPMVQAFRAERSSRSLGDLAETGPLGSYGLMRNEAETMRVVAAGLASYAHERGLNEDEGACAWATEASIYSHAPKLEPYAGHANGIGPALFCYLRLLCGARNAIKPDSRVSQKLNDLGFNLPGPGADEHAVLVVALAAAEEIGIELAVLDQLLYYAK